MDIIIYKNHKKVYYTIANKKIFNKISISQIMYNIKKK